MNTALPQDVLNYWHGIEFFNHYDLDEEIKKARKDEHAEFFTSISAPSSDEWRRHDGLARDVYFLPFDMAQVSAIATARIASAQSELQRRRDEEFAPEGLSCFAKMRVLADGTPDFQSLSLSTLPWATGKLLQDRLGELCADAFEASADTVVEEMKSLWSCREEDQVTPPLLARMARLLQSWAGFAPAGDHAAWIDILKRRGSAGATEAATTDASETEAQDLLPPPTQELPILNSFYYHDLKFAAASLRAPGREHPLHAYLSANWPDKLDLETAAGEREIHATLAPALSNDGRWPAEPAQLQSLMQQFALNKMRALRPGQLLSVNGPPGTGKTTLVKDLIADLVVQRAGVLAGLANAKDGLASPSGKLRFGTGNAVSLPTLIPALTGFEIVVASSNNGAVENLSLELPQLAGIAANRQATLRYVAEVATKYAGTRAGKPWQAPGKPVWGLMSAALGKAANRRRFQQIFGYNASHPAASPVEQFLAKDKVDRAAWDEAGAMSFWRWREQRASLPSFAQARQHFLEAQKAHAANLAGIISLRDKWLAFVAHWQAAKADLELHTGLDHPNGPVAVDEELVARTGQLQRQADACKLALWPLPVRWLMRWFSKDKFFAWRQAKARALQAQILRDELDQVLRLQARTGSVHLWDGLALASERNQAKALWQGPQYNEGRNALFAAAMDLHQAFFLEAAPTEVVFAMGDLLSKRVTQGDPLVAWQWLFMLVPVVSSTFASIRNQFRGVDPGSLGWLIIDEAGQAVPQAAVGALLRAQRAVVVGDPLQIEPVVPLPSKLEQELGKVWLGANAEAYCVHQHSVQTLADRVHAYGVRHPLHREEFIGIPLVMHRRCDNPMFNVANKIAYAERMRHAKPGSGTVHPVLGKSNWWQVQGNAERGKYVPAQGELLFERLIAFYVAQTGEAAGQVPKVYIITPFREVKAGLVDLLLDAAQWRARLAPHGVKAPGNLEPLRANIGTVHTFQGKEEDIVFFVLGCDERHLGAAKWAASAPNLLNVAVTRAKTHCYIIGDKFLWGELNYFQLALKEMTQK